jgi:hypothetical protein
MLDFLAKSPPKYLYILNFLAQFGGSISFLVILEVFVVDKTLVWFGGAF